MAADDTYEITVGGVTYEVLAEVGEWDYQWHIGVLMRGPEGLAYAATSGCSCYGFSDNVEADDIKPVKSWHEAVELSKEDFSASDVATFAERLMALRPTG